MTTTDRASTDHTDVAATQYPEWALTERVIGCVYRVYNVMKFGHPERYYQRAVAEEFASQGIRSRREVYWPVRYGGRIVGRYFFDFLVEDVVLVELKIAPEVFAKHAEQVLAYLRASGVRVGLVCLITQRGVKVKRFIV